MANSSPSIQANSLLVVLALLCAGSIQAQEEERVEQPEQVSENRKSVIYIGAPVALSPDVDTALPVIPVPEDPANDPQFRARFDSILDYNDSLQQVESLGGAWAPALVEQLSALGRLHQQQGDHPDAISAFDRAIHINRINGGLHTPEQIPAVEQLIESYLAVGDWEQVDIYYNYLFYIQQKAYGPNDPRLIPVLDRLAHWNIQAFHIGYGDALGFRLSKAQIMFSAAARMVGVHFGKGDERFVDYLRNLANSSYLVSSHPELMMELSRMEFQRDQIILRDKLRQGEVIPVGFRAGEKALLDIASYYSEVQDPTYDLAEALTNVGDWYLMFSRRAAAFERYEQAWLVVQDLENSETVAAQLFGQVLALPAYNDGVDSLIAGLSMNAEAIQIETAFVDFEFDVTRAGIVRNLEVLTEQTPQNSNQISKVRREIRSSRFRPVLVEGETSRTNGVRFRYQYWY